MPDGALLVENALTGSASISLRIFTPAWAGTVGCPPKSHPHQAGRARAAPGRIVLAWTRRDPGEARRIVNRGRGQCFAVRCGQIL